MIDVIRLLAEFAFGDFLWLRGLIKSPSLSPTVRRHGMPIKGKKVPSLQGAVHQMSCCFAILDFRRAESEARLCQIFTDDLERFYLSRCDENVWSISTRDFIVERVCHSMLRIEVKGLPNDLFKASVTMMIMRFLPVSRRGASRKATRSGACGCS